MLEVINFRQGPSKHPHNYLSIVLRGDFPPTLPNTTIVVGLNGVTKENSIEEIAEQAIIPFAAFDYIYASAVIDRIIGVLDREQFMAIANRSESTILPRLKASYPELFATT